MFVQLSVEYELQSCKYTAASYLSVNHIIWSLAGGDLARVSIFVDVEFLVFLFVQMSAMKAANKDLKGTMKTLKIDDIDVRPFYLVCLDTFFSVSARLEL